MFEGRKVDLRTPQDLSRDFRQEVTQEVIANQPEAALGFDR